MIHPFEKFLHEKIPLSQAMGISLLHVSEGEAQIHCPLKPNRNHKGTAFGGSISAAHLLACYAWLFYFLNSKKIEAHLVVKESQIQFLKPVTADFTVSCANPGLGLTESFLKVLDKKGRAKVTLNSKIEHQGLVQSTMIAEFVAVKS